MTEKHIRKFLTNRIKITPDKPLEPCYTNNTKRNEKTNTENGVIEMRIFQLRTIPHGVERFQQFLDEQFICIGWPGLGNLAGISKDDLRDKIGAVYESTGHKLGYTLGQVNAFVNTMQTGDTVIISNKGWAHIGTVGDYEYAEQYDNETDGMCHRRSVQWLGRAPITDLNTSIQTLLRNRNTIAEYPHTFEESGLSQILDDLSPFPTYEKSKLDNLFDVALGILETELTSEDPDRRLRAATELIRLRKG